MAKGITTGIIGVFLLILAWGSFFTVAPGERVVVTRNGAIIGEGSSGLNFKLPIIDGANSISIQPQKAHYGDKDANGAGHVEAYSSDQQPAGLVFSINYHVTDVSTLYTNFRDIDTLESKVIDPKVLEIVKNVFGQFEAASAIQHRSVLNQQVLDALTKSFGQLPVHIDSFQMEDIAFSDKYERAVEDRMEATVHQQQALADKARRITNADAAAYEVKAAADASAHALTVKGEADAHVIDVKGKALRDNPGIVELTLATNWKGNVPSTVLPGTAMPFVNVPAH